MLKHLPIFAAAVVLAVGPVYAQKQEAVLHYIEAPGAGHDFILAAPKPGGRALSDLGNIPEALVMHLHDGELAIFFDDAQQMIKTSELLSSPACAIPLGGQGPIALYAVPKSPSTAGSGSAMGTQVAATECLMVFVPSPEHTTPIRRAQSGAD
jgi:hypothetical protein